MSQFTLISQILADWNLNHSNLPKIGAPVGALTDAQYVQLAAFKEGASAASEADKLEGTLWPKRLCFRKCISKWYAQLAIVSIAQVRRRSSAVVDLDSLPTMTSSTLNSSSR